MNTLMDRYANAVKQMELGNWTDAEQILKALKAENKGMNPFCNYQLASVNNALGNPEAAYDLYYEAFKQMPNITSALYTENHPNRHYVFNGIKPEKSRTDCPLCGEQGIPHWTYSMTDAAGYNPDINPVRMWMHCKPCNHLFARNFPEKIFLHNANPRRANAGFFPYYSNILTNIRRYAPGMSLFEVGVGASECLLAAREIGYETFGIDVIARHVEDAKSLYGLDTETADFNVYESDKQWDVIIMGDVLEHVSDPVRAIEKAKELLSPKGALWISTPNFESAVSAVTGHDDVMRKQQYHLNYFSRESLYATLERFGLRAVDYQISGHYKGSMEVIAVKI